jgi:hypothetical protein
VSAAAALAGDDEGTYWHGQFESAIAALADLRREHIETVAEIERLRHALDVIAGDVVSWESQTRGTVAHRMTTGGYTACGRRLWTSTPAPESAPRCGSCLRTVGAR